MTPIDSASRKAPPPSCLPRLLVAGATSSSGKTTLAAGIAAALHRRGRRVQPFKCGPDYIDPSYHARAAQRPCHNLDTWMLPPARVRRLFVRTAQTADVAVIEGVMGLFDGRGPEGEGSTASVARAIRAPVILALDVAGTAQSAGAIALGFRQYDPDVQVVGVVLNNVGSDSHLRLARQAVEDRAGLPVLGYLPRRAELTLPGRHLGLVPTDEDETLVERIDAIRAQVEASVDVDALLRLAQAAPPLEVTGPDDLFPSPARPPRVTIAVAQDPAFNFYYQDNLDLLAAWGARLAPTSPLADQALPAGAAGLYIGGGFPELFAGRLAANQPYIESVRRAAAEGMPIYAECGGLMYLAEGIVTFAGERHPLVGLVPGWCAMQERRVRLGYVLAEASRDSLLARRGERLRGHAFHWSRLEGGTRPAAYRLLEPVAEDEGMASGMLLASYLHLHFGSRPELAPRFVAACAGD